MSASDQFKFHLAALLRYLGVRNRSRVEIERYLKKRIPNEAETTLIVQLIKYLEDNQLIHDESFASEWITAKIHRGQGYLKIMSTLKARGVDERIIKEQLGRIDTQIWVDAACKLLEKNSYKWHSLPKLEKYRKAFAYLTMHGFLGAHSRAAIDQWGYKRVE